MSVANPDAKWMVEVQSAGVASVSNPAFGYSSWTGKYADAATESDLPDVVMVDPCTIEWAFTDGQVPSQFEPSRITFTLWARSAAKLPTSLKRGTMVSWALTINPWKEGVPSPVKNPAAKLAFAVAGGRITEAVLQLVPGSAWPARMTITAADLLAELPSLFPAITDAATTRRKARERLVQIATRITDPAAGAAGSYGIIVGLPTGTPDGANPPLIGGLTPRCNTSWDGNARDQLSAWCNANDVMPGGVICPWWDNINIASYPAGYGSPVPSAWYATALAPPLSNTKYVIASGAKPNPNKLPLRLTRGGERDGRDLPINDQLLLRLTYAPEGDQHTAAIDGEVVEVPGTMRSSREHAPNLFTFTGMVEGIDASVTPNIIVERASQAQVGVGDWGTENNGGARGRTFPTLLELGTFQPQDTTIGDFVNAPLATYAAPFTPDAYAYSTAWALDAVTVRVDKMSMAEARSVVPKLMPAYPTAFAGDMDGVVVRHVTLFNLDPAITRPGDPMPQGYVTSGRVILEAGRMVYEMTLTPGAAQSTGTRITVGDVDAASWHAMPAGDIDRSIRVADLALVDF